MYIIYWQFLFINKEMSKKLTQQLECLTFGLDLNILIIPFK